MRVAQLSVFFALFVLGLFVTSSVAAGNLRAIERTSLLQQEASQTAPANKCACVCTVTKKGTTVTQTFPYPKKECEEMKYGGQSCTYTEGC
uniref:Uncharacterized protein n=1 Tax=Chromera velia CCMP2878 TaxID=1169474 RepID=A0A0G4FYP5_9ALVE|eukprot:Cvel_19298.t1-p1 / transcript=Cvel_19298.t1 / gene=Cvel_19298 / organism=Chromera_velia_CCMP2878 / gene_product=hypothetical protein / transcript_product=hypothetical protein / location=Cvel_scaffold1652:38424-39323(-) / protein_length=90 / sequence_SO=supercontig / SO=protein_coding / is_pseudo=false